MKRTTMNLIVLAAMLFGSLALAADEAEDMAQPADETESMAQPADETEDMPQPAEVGTDLTESVEQPAMPTESNLQPSTEPPRLAPYDFNGKRDKPTKHNRSKTLDLRYCLELENNVEIAKCAGE
jgi:hypothetical protein